MTWTKVSDDLPERLEVADVGRSARWLLVELYAYANRLQLDGCVPRKRLARISDADDVDTDLAELIAAGFASIDGDTVLVPWDDQLTAEHLAKKREQATARKRRERAHAAGDHSLCDRCSSVTRDRQRDVTRDRRREGKRDGAAESAAPDPTRPDPKESGSGQCATHVGMPMPCVSCAADAKAGD